jgi:DNA-binding transcriptional LysR family regulator
MLKLDSLLAFVRTAEAGSISEAARRLQISKSVVSERLAELERNIGATLMRRSTRKLILTEDGIVLLERAKRILREISEATAEVSEKRGELVGPLRISAPVSFGILHLAPALNAFLSQNPRIELSVDLDDRFVSTGDGFDAVIRHGPLPDNGWIAKRFAPGRRMLVASPDYLKKHGTPRSLGDLGAHRGIIYSIRGASDWRFRQGGRWSVVRPGTVMRVNNGIIMRDAAVAGLGIALLTTFIVYDSLSSGKLQRLDVGAEAESATIFIAYPNDQRVSAKVRALITHLHAAFGKPPYWERSALKAPL